MFSKCFKDRHALGDEQQSKTYLCGSGVTSAWKARESLRHSIPSLANRSGLRTPANPVEPDSHLLPFGNHVTKNFALEVKAEKYVLGRG